MVEREDDKYVPHRADKARAFLKIRHRAHMVSGNFYHGFALRRPAAMLLAMATVSALAGPKLEQFTISQAVPARASVETFLDVRKTGDTPVEALPPSSVEGWFDGSPLPLTSLRLFSQTHDGIAYVFLVDISRSE